MIRTIVLLVLIGISSGSFAQRGLTSENKKALKAYDAGLACLRQRDKACAEVMMNKALDADQDFIEPRLILAELYAEQGKRIEAIAAYEAVLSLNERFFTNAFFQLGELKFEGGNLDEAEKHYREFLDKTSPHNELRANAHLGLDNIEFVRVAVGAPVPFDPVNLGFGVNTIAPEYYPCLTADGNTLMFTRMDGVQEDFFQSSKVDGEFGPATIVQGVSTKANEGAGTLSADGRYLIYTACDQNGAGDFGGGRKGIGSCDLFISIRIGNRWSQPQNLGSPVNSSIWESQPSLAADGRSLYFIRGTWTSDGKRVQDIYLTKLGDNGEWSKPEKLGLNINTPFIEESVQIHPDGQTLYFTSNGHPGMGGLDIYLSRKQKDGSWGKAINVGHPINTAGDENSVLVSTDGSIAVFGSTRDGGFGDLDLYGFAPHSGMAPNPVTYVTGKVFDKVTKAPLEADVALLDLETGERVAGSYSDPSTGVFLVCIPSGRDYALNATAQGYLFYSENYSIADVLEASEPYALDVPMAKPSAGAVISLRNVFFETGSASLMQVSELELDRLVALLRYQKDLRIEVSGHTDSVGDDSDNLKLSDQRAQAVKEYLVAYGIAADRLEAKGYGETKPVGDNETPAGRAQNRRTEVKIL